MEAQTGITSIPVNKKENLSFPAFSKSLNRHKYEDVGNWNWYVRFKLVWETNVGAKAATFSSILYWLSLKKPVTLNDVQQFDIPTPRNFLRLQ